VAESLVVSIRIANERDLPAMEWDGEYRRFRRLYQTAIAEAQMGRRVILVAEVEGSMAGQIFVQLGTSMAILRPSPWPRIIPAPGRSTNDLAIKSWAKTLANGRTWTTRARCKASVNPRTSWKSSCRGGRMQLDRRCSPRRGGGARWHWPEELALQGGRRANRREKGCGFCLPAGCVSSLAFPACRST
jgi:hypothetical protein